VGGKADSAPRSAAIVIEDGEGPVVVVERLRKDLGFAAKSLQDISLGVKKMKSKWTNEQTTTKKKQQENFD